MSRKFSVKKKKVIFSKGPIHLLDCDVRMGNRTLSRQIIEHPGSIVIIPRISKDRYILIRQFRFAVKKWIWEFPAGGLERGESLRHAAKRELMEEVGYRPRKLKKLTRFYPSPGVSGEVMHLFLAEELTPEKLEGDEDEEIKARVFSLRQLNAMLKSGKISDVKTMLGIKLISEMKK